MERKINLEDEIKAHRKRTEIAFGHVLQPRVEEFNIDPHELEYDPLELEPYGHFLMHNVVNRKWEELDAYAARGVLINLVPPGVYQYYIQAKVLGNFGDDIPGLGTSGCGLGPCGGDRDAQPGTVLAQLTFRLNHRLYWKSILMYEEIFSATQLSAIAHYVRIEELSGNESASLALQDFWFKYL